MPNLRELIEQDWKNFRHVKFVNVVYLLHFFTVYPAKNFQGIITYLCPIDLRMGN
jgi:hypothetical protein